MNRSSQIAAALVSLAILLAAPSSYSAESDLADIKAEVAKRHDESMKRLADWIKQVSIAAKDRGFPEGAEHMAREAGFQRVEIVPTKGKPGVFATVDAGATRTVGLYFMYDVKQFDPAEWKPGHPLSTDIIDKPGFGKVMIARAADSYAARPNCSRT